MRIAKKVLIALVAVVVLALAGVALSLPFSYQIAALTLRIGCTENNPPLPADYDRLCQVTEKSFSDVDYGSVYGGDVLDIIQPAGNVSALPLVVYIHGGYYVGGDKLSKEPYCRVIAEAGYVVANVNYILAPDGHYPSQLLQLNEAIAYLCANAARFNIDTNKIFIGGDSAGGHLSGQLGVYYTNPELSQKFDATPAITKEQLRGVVLLCGFFDTATLRATKFPFVNSAMWMLTDVKDYESYDRIGELNTIYNVTADYPATYITCGDKDPFYPQNQAMVAKLKEKGVAVTDYLPTTTDKKLQHEFQTKFDLPECAEAMRILKSFLAERCA